MQTIPAASTAPDFLIMLADAEEEHEDEASEGEVEDVSAGDSISHGDHVSHGDAIPGSEQSS